MRGRVRTLEQVVAELAARSHGVVTREELLRAGVPRGQIDRRVARGFLITVHRGVYRVGHLAPSTEAAYMAAVRAGGGSAMLSHRAAGHLWRLTRGKPPRPEILTATERRIPGVVVHRIRRTELPPAARCAGIPITSIPRTLVDLASSLPGFELARACHEAKVRYGIRPGQVEVVLERLPNSPGARELRRVLHGDTKVSMSYLERRFLALLRKARLPQPQTNILAGGRRVDCRWPQHRLTVELDGYRFHNTRHAWELDRQRERAAHARGDVFRRYTYADVLEDPRAMLRELRDLLGGLS